MRKTRKLPRNAERTRCKPLGAAVERELALWARLPVAEPSLRDEARGMLVRSIDGIIWLVIWRYAGRRPQEADDLYQQAVSVLLAKAHLFDPDKGRFATWADRWVRQTCQRWMFSSLVQAPVHLFTHKKAGAACPARVALARKALTPVSLANELPLCGRKATTYADILEARPEPQAHAREVIDEVVSRIMPERDREIFRRRARGETLREVASAVGISHERVNQIMARAKAQFVDIMARIMPDVLDDFLRAAGAESVDSLPTSG